MSRTIAYDKVELDKKIMKKQNDYIVCSPVMLRRYVDQGFDPIPPDAPVFGAVVNRQIEYILNQVRLGKTDLDVHLFPYVDEVGVNVIASFNDIKSMPNDIRSAIARKSAIDIEFYNWVCLTNGHISLD